MVSVIIPAFNEEATIARKVGEVIDHPSVREVIVVDDGSNDRTAALAAAAGARVIHHARNGGKAAALDAGVAASSGNCLLFLDADVTGYTHAALSRIIDPVVSGHYEMFVGIRARRTIWLNRVLHFFPIIGGERALTRELWSSVPHDRKQGFQIEITLNYFAKQTAKGMGFALIPGTRHYTKEKKYGLMVGLFRRAGMIRDVVAVSFRLYVLGHFARRGNARAPHPGPGGAKEPDASKRRRKRSHRNRRPPGASDSPSATLRGQ
ncbi:MAG TPA: glycosyltransferase [Gammaproteobacteria bacterium]